MSLNKIVAYATKSFALPDMCLRIRALLDDPRADLDAVGKAASLDPSLAAKVLRLANSALFRFPSQVDSINKAVSIIGGEALFNLVVAETANSAFKHFDSPYISLEKHWHNAVYTGIVARYLARFIKLRGSERFFVIGVLQSLSELILAKVAEDKYKAYISDDTDRFPAEKQKQYFGFTFAQCSGAILEAWSLPLTLYYPLKHADDKAKQSSDNDVCVLAMASNLATVHLNKEKFGNVELCDDREINILGLEDNVLRDALGFADTETANVAKLM